MHAPSRPATIRSSWWYVARLIAFRPGLYILSALGIISFYLWPLVPGIFIRQIFDQLSNQTLLADDARATIWALAGVLIGVAIARMVTALAYPGEKAAMLVADTLMRHNLLRHILGRPGANALPPDSSPGEAVSRLRDDMAHISVFMTWTADPVGQVLAFGIAFVTLARIDLRITLFGFLPLVVILTFVNLLNNRIRRYRKANQESIGQVTGLLGELFGAVQAVKVAGAEAHVVAHLQHVNEIRRAAALRDKLLTNLINAFSFGATNIATGVLLILAAQSLQSSQVTVGDFALFASYLGWMAFVMGMVGGYVTRYQQVGVSLRRAVELLQGAPSTLLVQHDSDVRMRGPLPAIAAPAKHDQLATPNTDGHGADLSLSRQRSRCRGGQSAHRARAVRGYHGAYRQRQKHLAAGAAWVVAAAGRRGALERPPARRLGSVHGAATGRLHTAGATAVQRNPARQPADGLRSGATRNAGKRTAERQTSGGALQSRARP